MRLFLAIELPREVKEHLAALQRVLEPQLGSASITRDHALHATLKFLGEVDPSQLEPITESLAAVSGGAIELTVAHAECFPERGSVRIVAAGFGGDLKRLKALHGAIEQRAVYLGFRREDRPYRAHVTLARARPVLPPATRKIVSDLTAPLWPGPTFTAGAFVLFQSRLTPQGSQYTKLHEFPL
ncbi:MAG TPA: RNA 2',3'-cyclic phosphodiesterase [Tepidisphaeraceae bacterium]|nr:RNA 2',3'-cyclic phosphodiesterase [Tepidisphaeraceae bacterium]